ncbi:MAG TPA: potassium/proton antiporter [Marinagarivorans sp.]
MSIDLTYQIIFGAAFLALLCVLASAFTRRIGAPVLLIFLILGMLAGEDGPGRIDFDDFELAFLFGNIALAMIIFDGGLGTRKETFRISLKPALSLATFGVVLTAGITGAAVHFILNLPWLESLLIGAIVGSTDAAAVFGLLRNAGFDLKERTGATLEIESGSNDPMAIFLTITLVEVMQLADSQNQGWAIASEFVKQMGLGLVLGYGGGLGLSYVLKRLPLMPSLYPLLALAGGMSIFGLTALWGGSGFLAIFIAGAMLGNQPLPYSNDIHRFQDGIAWLSQIGMFLMLGLLVTPSDLPPIMIPALFVALILIFVARPVAVLLSLLPFRYPWREQLFISWCGLRGAVPIILALFPSLAGVEQTKTVFELVFFVVLISLVLQGWTIARVAGWLQVALPPSSKEPEYLQLKIQQEQDKEIFVYRVLAGSSAEGRQLKTLPAIQGSQVIGIIRRGVLVEEQPDKMLESDDQIMILADANARAGYSRLFVPAPFRKTNNFFGEFVVNADTSLAAVAEAYGFEVPASEANFSISQCIVKRFHGKPVVGDSIKLGGVKLVVIEVDGDRIESVGLKLGGK